MRRQPLYALSGSEDPTAARCSSAPHPISTSINARSKPRESCWRFGCRALRACEWKLVACYVFSLGTYETRDVHGHVTHGL